MLFLRELKKVVFSISFFVLIAGTIAMVASQGVLDMSGQEKLEMPQPGQDYGTQAKEIPEVIMPAAIQVLYGEFCTNSYTAYPIGFYKNVRLSYDKRQQMAEIISALTGTPADELMQAAGESTQDGNSYTFDDSEIDVQGNGGYTITTQDSMSSDDETGFSIALTDDISYEEFLSYMKKADKLIGGGSFYSDTYLANSFGQTAITYEEAVDSYNLIKDSDHFTGAYARLFCDYMLIVLSVLPVFIAVALCLKDKQTSMNGLIYSRTASSARIILTRYLAIITAVMVPAVILFYISSASIWGMYNGMKLDYLIPLKYCFGWILPSVMVSTAVGMLLTELTNTPAAIAVQGLWWFIDINLGVSSIQGGYPLLRLAPRHNSLQGTRIFLDNFNRLAANRLMFAGFAILLMLAAVVIYEQKRRGRLNGYGKIKKLFSGMANR